MTLHPGPAPPRRERVERQEPLHRLGRRRPDREGPRRGRPRRRAAARGRAAARRRAHLAAAPRDHHRATSPSTPPTATGSRSRRSWRLNERHYGALQGKDKKQTLEEYGEEQFMLWRRSFDTPPPPHRRRRRVLPGRRPALRRPRRRDAAHRVPQGRHRPVPALLGVRRSCPTCSAGKTVLVAAHGNSLRALVKHLDGISDEDIAGLNIPTGMPLVYRLDDDARARPSPAASTSTPRPPPPPPPPSPTRAADRSSPGRGRLRWARAECGPR